MPQNPAVAAFLFFGLGATHTLVTIGGTEADGETQFSTTWGGGFGSIPATVRWASRSPSVPHLYRRTPAVCGASVLGLQLVLIDLHRAIRRRLTYRFGQ